MQESRRDRAVEGSKHDRFVTLETLGEKTAGDGEVGFPGEELAVGIEERRDRVHVGGGGATNRQHRAGMRLPPLENLADSPDSDQGRGRVLLSEAKMDA